MIPIILIIFAVFVAWLALRLRREKVEPPKQVHEARVPDRGLDPEAVHMSRVSAHGGENTGGGA